MPYQKNKRWYTEVWDNYNRKRIRRVVKVPGKRPEDVTRADALKVEKVIRGEIEKGTFSLPTNRQKLKLNKLVELFLNWSKENRISYRTDKSICKGLLEFFGEKNVNDLTLWEIEQFKQKRKKEGRTPETINKDLGALRRMINLAIEWQLLDINPLLGMKLLRVPVTMRRTIKDWEFAKLYGVAPEHFKPILLCAYFTGMRRGEIQNLKWDDVNFEENYILVSRSKNNEYRTIPICENLKHVLNELKQDKNSEFVFNTPKGLPYKSNTAWKRVWNNTIIKSGIEHCRFHDLRHTFVSDLIVGCKEDFATVMALSGHKDIKMLKRYSHTREDAKRAAVKKLDDRFRNFDEMKENKIIKIISNANSLSAN